MNPAASEALRAVLGEEGFSQEEKETLLYSRDLTPLPFRPPGVRSLPEAVVRPGSVSEVREVLSLAQREGLPVTPRAAGTSALFAAVPVRGGLLLDLNRLRGVHEFQPAESLVRVGPATRWGELEAFLRSRGFALLSYPTSAPASTVGGWFSSGGLGVGSLAYGPLSGQVREIEVVLAGGQLVQAGQEGPRPLGWFAGAEGTLGIVTGLNLRVRPAPDVERSHLLALPSPQKLLTAATALATGPQRPYSLHFWDQNYALMLERAGFSRAAPSRPLLRVDFQGSAATVATGEEFLARVGRENDALDLGPEIGEREWADRFREIRAKRGGPTLLGAEFHLPLPNLARFLEKIEELGRRHRLPLFAYGTIPSPTGASVQCFYPSDERRGLHFWADLALVELLHREAHRLGGVPYTVGYWNTPYRPGRTPEARERRAQKAALDPEGLLNPGKLHRSPALLRWARPLWWGVATGGRVFR